MIALLASALFNYIVLVLVHLSRIIGVNLMRRKVNGIPVEVGCKLALTGDAVPIIY